jgi:hypothetical protein
VAARFAVAIAFLIVAVFLVWRRNQPAPAKAVTALEPVGAIRFSDPELHARVAAAEEAYSRNPEDANAIRALAHIYAVAIANRDFRLEERARAHLDASDHLWLVSNAAHSLQHLFNRTVRSGNPDRRLADQAERYFLRAQTMDPSLDRAKILPRIDVEAIQREQEETERKAREFQERFVAAEREIVRLPIDEFPELPLAVANVLRAKRCTIPQSYDFGEKKHNVIRGEFFRRGEEGWAVLCSVGGSSSILVFRSEQDPQPDELGKAEDFGYLQTQGGEKIGFSRIITAVDREYIVRHYEAYDGPKPPPIDHHGIDDAFAGKFSGIHFFHQGKWFPLQGAD